VQTSSAAVDVPPKGMSGGKFSPGDSIVIRDRLFNRRPQLGRPAGAKIGTDQSKLTFVTDTAAKVVGSADFPGGTVRFQGRLSIAVTTGTIKFVITGGTGKYVGARGTASEPASDNDPTNATNTYSLILP
jgi:hypothetical protein